MSSTDLANWPALVLTAGLATRLRPLSSLRAKAALPLAGEPLIGRILRWLHAAGIRRAVLNLHHLPESITAVVGDGAAWGLHVSYSWEPEVLGSAGGPRRALDLLGAARFLVVNGDTLTNCDLGAVVRQHVATGTRVTMAVVRRAVPRAVLADQAGVVTGFGPGTEHFIGVQAAEADVFGRVPENQPYETVKALYPQLVSELRGSVRVYRSDAEFLDVGTVADYFKTVSVVARREGRGFDRGSGVKVHEGADVCDSVLWNHIEIGEHARLKECIVTDDVVVPDGRRYERCVLINGDDGLAVTPF